jgi:uncharacterized protein YjbI with pentapeptide repeats
MTHLKEILDRLKKRPLVIIFLFVAIVILAWSAYLRFVRGQGWASWTGFGEFLAPDDTYYPPKTLWDVLDLLIVPFALGVLALWFNRQEKTREQALTLKRQTQEQELARDRQREYALQNFLDTMTGLLLEKNLSRSKIESEIRNIARAKTLTTLRTLDGKRRGFLIQFLHESGLLSGNKPLNLEGADIMGAYLCGANLIDAKLPKVNLSESNLCKTVLMGADLREAKLSKAKLRGVIMSGDANLSRADLHCANLHKAIIPYVNLFEANLSCADLSEVDLSEAYLVKANLTGADLTKATLIGAEVTDEQLASAGSLEGATMPDGKIYDPKIHKLSTQSP